MNGDDELRKRIVDTLELAERTIAAGEFAVERPRVWWEGFVDALRVLLWNDG